MEDWNYGDEWESQVLVAGRRKRVVGIKVKERGKKVVDGELWWKGNGSVGGGRFLSVDGRMILVVVNRRLLMMSGVRGNGGVFRRLVMM